MSLLTFTQCMLLNWQTMATNIYICLAFSLCHANNWIFFLHSIFNLFFSNDSALTNVWQIFIFDLISLNYRLYLILTHVQVSGLWPRFDSCCVNNIVWYILTPWTVKIWRITIFLRSFYVRLSCRNAEVFCQFYHDSFPQIDK